LLAVVLAVAVAPPALAAPPAVNLRVEMRVVEQAVATRGEGAVTIGTRGGTPAVAGSVRVATDRNAADEVQQVLVQNGASAALRASRLRALPTGEWFWGGDQAGFAQTRQWIDAGRGFTVRPAWPGGAAPAQVEISTSGDTAATTRLALPLGEWLTFARRADGLSETLLQLRLELPQR
jgi:hypothetical protein